MIFTLFTQTENTTTFELTIVNLPQDLDYHCVFHCEANNGGSNSTASVLNVTVAAIPSNDLVQCPLPYEGSQQYLDKR